MMTEEQVMEVLKKDNEEFRQLYQEHKDLNGKIDELNRKHYLTPEEDLEVKRMQKEKLHKKDRIAELIRDYRKSH